MKRYILTGTPGCGKTALLRTLEMAGLTVIDEAATDIIAFEQAQGNMRPWEHPRFIDDIVRLQRQRQIQASHIPSNLQFYDRSPVCAYALAIYLKMKPSHLLKEELKRINEEQVYEKQIFFIENLGFCTPSEARKITYDEALVFEKIHEDAYRELDYECIRIPPAPLLERIKKLYEHIDT